jgi:D-xylose transport system substrate-binding protein
MQAQALFDIQPSGNWVIIKGNSADANADFLRSGAEKVIGDAVAAGDITIVGEDYTDNWDPANAQTTMEQFLTAADNDIQVALVQNDGMAGGAIAALEAQGLAGQVPVSGQDGDFAALNRVALGTQTVDVWKDARELGTAAGEAAIALCGNPDPSAVSGASTFETPGGNELSSIFLEPIPITQDNLDVVVDAEWITVDELCAGVESGSVAACP